VRDRSSAAGRTTGRPDRSAWGAIRDSQRPRIYPPSPPRYIKRAPVEGTTAEDVKGQASARRRLAKSYCEDVRVSPMDATGLCRDPSPAESARIAVEEGRTVVTSPIRSDTHARGVRGLLPPSYEGVPALRGWGGDVCPLHDDMGMAVATPTRRWRR